MISETDLRSIAQARLQDSRILLDGNRFDGAVYMCGYAVEGYSKLVSVGPSNGKISRRLLASFERISR